MVEQTADGVTPLNWPATSPRGGTVKRKRRKANRAAIPDEVTYVCDSCGEVIVVPVDASAGTEQRFVEDCPVCCHPNVIQIDIDDDGSVRAWATSE